MAERKTGYIDVDKLMPQITVEQAAAFYGIDTGEMHRTASEIRTRCFLNCGKREATGNRALAIRNDNPAKQWKCHQYDCQNGGNLVGLCDLMKPGANDGGRPRGERFKAIAKDLQAMVNGEAPAATSEPTATTSVNQSTESSKPAKVNVPLKDSDNERARVLVDLDRKFITDAAEMNPKAAGYFRKRPYLSADVCHKWRMGYLPRDSGGDRAGGTMRDKVVYPMLNEQGEPLAWFGRDPEYEAKHKKWLAGGKEGIEPNKFQFVRGFHRGLELFGQHRMQDLQEGTRQSIEALGLLVVEGPNDVIAMDCLGERAVGLTSNNATDEQVSKIVDLARRVASGRVTLLLDCDEEGHRGAKAACERLAEHGYVRMAWSPSGHDEKYAGRQPESLSLEEWQALRTTLTT